MSDPTQAHDETEQPATQQPATQQPAEQRAEEIVDGVGERVGYFASSMAQRIRIATARTREEAEDMWAEAQSIRRGGKP